MDKLVAWMGSYAAVEQAGDRRSAVLWTRGYDEPPRTLRELKGILLAAAVCGAIWKVALDAVF